MNGRTWAIGSLDRSEPADRKHYKQVRRTVLFSFRITEDESRLLAEAAEREGRTPSEVARVRVFGPLAPVREERAA